MTARDLADLWDNMSDVTVAEHLDWQKGVRVGRLGPCPVSDRPRGEASDLRDLRILEIEEAGRQLR